MQKFSRVWVPDVIEDVLMKHAEASTKKKCCRLGLTSFDSQSQHPTFKPVLLFNRCKRNIWSLQLSSEKLCNCPILYLRNIFCWHSSEWHKATDQLWICLFPDTHWVHIIPDSFPKNCADQCLLQILPFKSYWHHIEGKYIKALS